MKQKRQKYLEKICVYVYLTKATNKYKYKGK